MKKLVSVFLFCLLLALSVTVYAGDVDITSLSDEELMGLKTRIEEELAIRGYDGAGMINQGVYHVGSEVKPGWYTFSVSDTSDPDSRTICQVFATEESFENNQKGDYANVDSVFDNVKVGEPVTFNLPEGSVLKLAGDQVCIYRNAPSWAVE